MSHSHLFAPCFCFAIIGEVRQGFCFCLAISFHIPPHARTMEHKDE